MKTRIYIALLAVILIVAGIVNTPNALEIARSQLAIIYLFGKTLVGLFTEPGCYGLIGFLILALVIGSIRVKRQRRKRLAETERKPEVIVTQPNNKTTIREVVENIYKEINSIKSSLAENTRIGKGMKEKKSSYPYGVPTKKYEDWARWKRTYTIIKPLTVQALPWDEIKRFVENHNTDLPSSLDTLPNILKAGDDGLLNEFPPVIKTS